MSAAAGRVVLATHRPANAHIAESHCSLPMFNLPEAKNGSATITSAFLCAMIIVDIGWPDTRWLTLRPGLCVDESQPDQLHHRPACGFGVTIGNRMVDGFVVGQGISWQGAMTLLEKRCPANCRANGTGERHQRRVPARLKDRVVEGLIGLAAFWCGEAMLLHLLNCMTHAREVPAIPPVRSERSSRGFHDSPKLKQIGKEIFAWFGLEHPAEHVGV